MHLDTTSSPIAVSPAVSFTKGTFSLSSPDDHVHVTAEFLKYLAEHQTNVASVEFVFVSTVADFRPSLRFAAHPDTEVEGHIVTLPMSAQLRLNPTSSQQPAARSRRSRSTSRSRPASAAAAICEATMAARKVLLIVNAGFGDLVASAASAKRIRDCLHGHGFVEPVCYVDRDATIANVHASLAAAPAARSARTMCWSCTSSATARLCATRTTSGRTSINGRASPTCRPLLITHNVHDPRSTEAGILGVDLRGMVGPNRRGDRQRDPHPRLLPRDWHGARPDRDRPQRRVRAAQDRVKRLVRMKYDTYRGTDKQTAAHEHRIVRLVATTQNEFAEEGPGIVDGKDIGLFSNALADSLGQPSSRRRPGAVLRSPAACARAQRGAASGVEGPRHRLPFSTEVRDPGRSSPCQFEASGSLTLIAGLAHGVETGDTYEVVHTDDPIPLMEVTVFAAGVARSAMHGAPRTGAPSNRPRAIPGPARGR